MAETKDIKVKEKQALKSPAEQTKPGIVFTPDVDIFESDSGITLLADMPGVAIDLDRVQTNILYFNLTSEVKVSNEAIVQRMLDHKVKILDGGPLRRFRFVTHAWIDRSDVDQALLAFKAALKS